MPNGDGVDQIGRRKWDLESYERQALEENIEDINKVENSKLVLRNTLQRHDDNSIDYASHIGELKVVKTNAIDKKDEHGFYCDVCDVSSKDSNTHLDHINSTKHQKMLGYNMRVEKATREQVQERILYHKKCRDERRLKNKASEIAKRLKSIEESLKNNNTKKKRKRKVPDNDKNTDQDHDEMIKLMGFGSFK